MKLLRPSFLSIILLALITSGAIFFLPHIHRVNASGPQTWYVRPDGGTRYSVNFPTGQCDGQADAPYPGTGVNQHCAFNDVRMFYQDGSYVGGLPASFPGWGWIGSGGDTYIIKGSIADGVSYPIGPNSNSSPCDSTGCWGIAGQPQSSGIPTPPSGTAGAPTRILGGNYSSCSAQSARTQLYGTWGVGNVLSLYGDSYVNAQCLDITDHSDCGLATDSNPCVTNGITNYSYAKNGIQFFNTSNHINLADIRIHGLGGNGIIGATGDGLVATDIAIIGNAVAGWNADDGSGQTGVGSFNVSNFNISWNGCVEEYPIADTLPYFSCTDQSSGGYGDGFGTASLDSPPPGWQVHFDNGIVSYNTQDGLDALHIGGAGSTMTDTRILAFGNEGQQLKVGGAIATIQNSMIVGNCEAMSTQAIPGTPTGFGSRLAAACRAGNTAIVITTTPGDPAIFQDNTIYAAGAIGLEVEYSTDDTGPRNTLKFNNNVFMGFYNSGSQSNATPIYSNTDLNMLTNPGGSWSNNATYGQRSNWPCPALGEVNAICSDPKLVDETYHPYGYGNMVPTSNSPLIAAGTPISGLTTDFNGATRGNPPTIGAIEVAGSGSGGGSNPPPSDTTPPSTSITSPSNNATVSGNITITASASDNVGVSSVALYIDGSPRATDASSPYSFSLDTTSLSNGSHTFVTKASDASGNVGTSGTITVTVSNVSGGGTSTSTPSSTPTGPSGYTFCSLEGTTCSFSGTESVAYGAGSSFNYLTLTNSTPCGNSIFTDPDSGVAKACFTKPSTPSSTPDTTPPTTSITAPISGGTLSGTASITASASDNVGITSVALVIDGSIQGTDNTAPYTFSLNTSNLSNGIHILATKAYDAAGNIGTSANVLVTVSNAVTPPPVSSGGGGGGGGGSNVVSTPSFNITSISISNLTPTTAQITITTNIPASVSLKYGLTTLYGNTTGVSPSLTTNYEKLTNLTPNTIYDFVVIATPPGGTQVISPVSTFKTLPMGGSTSSGGTGIAGSASSSISIGSSGSSLPAFTQNLAYGDTNSEVTLLQTILHTQGFLPGVLGITNYFGVQTEHALLLFQSAHDLNKSGFVDLQTQTLLNKIEAAQGNAGGVVSTPVQTSPSTPSGSLTRNLAPGSVGPDVMILQHLLNQDGDYPQAIYSTHYGSLTEAAVKLFQAKYGLVNYGAPNTTGYGAVGPKTRVKLGGI